MALGSVAMSTKLERSPKSADDDDAAAADDDDPPNLARSSVGVSSSASRYSSMSILNDGLSVM